MGKRLNHHLYLADVMEHELFIGGHSDSEALILLHSCGTAPDSHRTFPVTSSGCSPLEPMEGVYQLPRDSVPSPISCLSGDWQPLEQPAMIGFFAVMWFVNQNVKKSLSIPITAKPSFRLMVKMGSFK